MENVVKKTKEEFIQEIVNSLVNLPNQIYDSNTKILSLSLEMSTKQEIVDTYINNYKIEIANEVDENNKKKFSNADARDSELKKRIDEYEGLNLIIRDINDIEKSIKRERIELELLNNKQNNYRVILNNINSL
jgi:hypothetical protein